MRETIGRMLGSLPEEFFDVTVSAARSEDLAQLCYSVIMTGAVWEAAASALAWPGVNTAPRVRRILVQSCGKSIGAPSAAR